MRRHAARFAILSAIAGVSVLAAGCPRVARKPLPGPVEQRVTIVAERFQFIPSTIDLTRGKEASVKIRSGDVAYGVAVPELGLRARVPAKKETLLKFTPERTGSFTLRCTAPAGPACDNMRGTIRIR